MVYGLYLNKAGLFLFFCFFVFFFYRWRFEPWWKQERWWEVIGLWTYLEGKVHRVCWHNECEVKSRGIKDESFFFFLIWATWKVKLPLVDTGMSMRVSVFWEQRWSSILDMLSLRCLLAVRLEAAGEMNLQKRSRLKI